MSEASSCSLVELDRLVLLLAQHLSKRGRIVGLTLVDWKVLIELFELSEHPNISLTTLAQRAGVQKGSVSRSLKTLRYFGQADCQQNPAHSRAYSISLTERGRDACDLAREHETYTSPFKVLDDLQREQVLALLRLAAGR